MKKLFVIDVMAMAFRNFHALQKRPLSTASGFPTSSLFGSAMFINRLVEEYRPDYMLMASDSQGKNFRHEIYPAYKANRGEMPEDLALQIPKLFEMFDHWNIPLIKMSGFEADDLIGTVSHVWKSDDLECFIVSGDKDFMQLIDEKTKLLSPQKGGNNKIVGPMEVQEKFCCTPDQVVDILALWGDQSDNVPGVPGIGEKTAAKLIKEFSSIEGIYENLDHVPNNKQKERLVEFKDQAFLSKRLVTIKTNVKLPLTLEECKINYENFFTNSKLSTFFATLEFNTLSEKYAQQTNEITQQLSLEKSVRGVGEKNKMEMKEDTFSSSNQDLLESNREHDRYNLIQTKVQWNKFKDKWSQCSFFSFDTETTGLDPNFDRPIGVSFTLDEKHSYYLPLIEKHQKELRETDLIEDLKNIFADNQRLKVAHNLKFDLQMLGNLGVKIGSNYGDSMIAAFICDSSRRSYSIDSLSELELGIMKIPTSELIGKKGETPMSEVPLDLLYRYACEDSECAYLLHKKFESLMSQGNLRSVYQEIDLPLIPILAEMEKVGVLISGEKLANISEIMLNDIQEIELKIYKLAGEKFNINSPKQLQQILFDKLNIPGQVGVRKIKKTKSGFSTDVSVLESLSKHPLPALILEYRSLAKLKNTYVDILPQLINEHTGRVHTSFHQTGTATGRLSSSHPNLQNIPIRSERGREIRTCFVSDQNHCIISADYSQIELRILAHVAKETNLAHAFSLGEDIHSATASKMFGKELSEVDGNDRSRAKAINYGIIYGMGAQRLAKSTGVSLKEAKGFIENYFASFPGIKGFIEQSIESATEKGFSETMTGRRRIIDGLDGSLGIMSQVNAKNMAVNSPIQGSAADLMKLAMIKVDAELKRVNSNCKMLLQVHDELVFECPLEEREKVVEIIERCMNSAMELTTPLKTDIGWGYSWLEAH